ncbi:MAG TPA: cytochrome P450 [Solirubrobacteraceae bacterium]|nr:cytochrome P450 [Solirubrobacteraceae bacterium]
MNHASCLHSSSGSDGALPPASPLPVLAQTLLVARWPHRFLEWHWRRYGNRFTVRTVGLPPLVFCSDKADIKAIVNAPADVLHPGAGAAVITPLVGEGSFILQEDHDHMARRRAVMPAFARRAVLEHTTMIHEAVEDEIASWPADEVFASHPRLLACALRVIVNTILGREDPRLPTLCSGLLAMFSVARSLMLQEPQLRHLPGWRTTWARFCEQRAMVDELLYELIEDSSYNDDTHSVLSHIRRGANSDDRHSTPQQVRDDVMSLILAGHEDTAAQLAWALLLIAHHPRVLRALLNEFERDEDTYLTATILEVMRHRPVFLFTIPRVVQRNFSLAGTTYEPPVHLLGCIYLMHHDPRLFPEPQSFLPERFLEHGPKPQNWMPWGGGRKRCPGSHFALLEMRTVLRAVLTRWEVHPASTKIETARWRSVIVAPSDGARIILKRRHKQSSRPCGGSYGRKS